jgi:hypothetical protein
LKNILLRLRVGVIVLALLIASIAIIPKAFAGTLSNTSVLEMGGASNVNPMIVGDPQSLAIALTPATTVSGGYTVTLTFGYGGTLWTQTSTPTSSSGVVAASGQTVANNGCTTLTGASTYLPGTLAVASNQAAGTITITSTGSGDIITSGTSYCAELTSTSAVTNPTTAADYNVNVATNSDSQVDTVDVLTAGQNAYTVTATIAPTFTMSLSTNTSAFGTLSSSTANLSGSVVTTIATNAKSGWYLWAEDLNAGLHSTIASTTIPSVTSSPYNFSTNAGTALEYGLGATISGTASGLSVPAGYAYTSGTKGGQLSSTAFNEIATGTGPASGSTGTLTAQVTSNELVDILPTTPPATDYTDTITLVGAGSF